MGIDVDTIIIKRVSSASPSLYDTAMIRTYITATPKIKIEKDSNAKALCYDTIKYYLIAKNLGNAYDIINLKAKSKHGWKIEFFDATGIPLQNTNNNGEPDLGKIENFGGERKFMIYVYVPDVPCVTIDTEIVYEISVNDSTVKDSAILITQVEGVIVYLSICNSVLPGSTVTYRINVVNYSYLKGVVEIEYSLIPPEWNIRLYDSMHNFLKDTDHDGIVDLDSVENYDTVSVIVKLMIPDSAVAFKPGQTKIRAFLSSKECSDNTLTIFINVLINPGVDIEYSQQDSTYPLVPVYYHLYVTNTGNG